MWSPTRIHSKTPTRKKIAQLLAIINKIKPLLQLRTLKQIYNLSYGLLAWYSNIHGNLTNLNILFKLQNKLFD